MNRFMGESWDDLLKRHFSLSWYSRSKNGSLRQIETPKTKPSDVFKTFYLCDFPAYDPADKIATSKK